LDAVASKVWKDFKPGNENLTEAVVLQETKKIFEHTDSRGYQRIEVDEFCHYFEKAANVLMRYRKKRLTALKPGEQLISELDLMRILPIGLCDGIALIAADDALAIGAHLTEARQKFNELDKDMDGLLFGDQINAIVNWTWTSISPGGRTLSKEQVATEGEKLRNNVEKKQHIEGVKLSGGRFGLDRDEALDFAEFAAYFQRTAETIARYHNRNRLAEEAA